MDELIRDLCNLHHAVWAGARGGRLGIPLVHICGDAADKQSPGSAASLRQKWSRLSVCEAIRPKVGVTQLLWTLLLLYHHLYE